VVTAKAAGDEKGTKPRARPALSRIGVFHPVNNAVPADKVLTLMTTGKWSWGRGHLRRGVSLR